jgi:hypothetical protein
MTATQLQFRRGTAAQMATFAGAPGEVVVDTTNNRIVVCDGATAGGFPAAKLSEVPGLTSYQGSGFVNRFRNANFDIAQRGVTGTVATSGGYTLDGWIVVPTGASMFGNRASRAAPAAPSRRLAAIIFSISAAPPALPMSSLSSASKVRWLRRWPASR